MIYIMLLVLALVVPIASYLAYRIDYMERNHPDYKGEDFP